MPENNLRIFSHELFLGFISKVSAYKTDVHIPSSNYLSKFFYHGEKFHGGLINSYVVIESESLGFIGRVTSIAISEKERLELSTQAMKDKDFHPLLNLEILAKFDYSTINFERSLTDFPNIGSKVYLCSEKFLRMYLKEIEVGKEKLVTSGLSKLLGSNVDIPTELSLQTIFSRHVAIVGTTGSGKSYTTANLITNLIGNNQKSILIDATGEYSDLADKFCKEEYILKLGSTHILPYEELTIENLFHLFTPAPQTQAPKLKQAIESLKLVEIAENEFGLNYFIEEKRKGIKTLVKTNKDISIFNNILNRNIDNISGNFCDFDIMALPRQIENECIWPTQVGKGKTNLFGDRDDRALGHCISLITRIETLIRDDFYNKIFDFTLSNPDSDNIICQLETFVKDKNRDSNLLYIDISEVPFAFQIREIVVDIIGERLLNQARKNTFKERPLTIFIDEAHQFLNKNTKKNFVEDHQELESFGIIAKEGRKYGIFLTLSTQLPRDIPIEILSQIGTFIAHRLINQRDKEIVMHSLPTVSREVINYLPALGEGEAIISGAGLKDNLYVKINKPEIEPISDTPIFS